LLPEREYMIFIDKMSPNEIKGIMNQEIYSILNTMKTHLKNSPPIATSDRQTHLMVQASQLQVLLAEEAEKNAIKAEKATIWIVRLTWAIVILTVIMVLAIFLEFPKKSIESNKNPTLSTQQTEKNNSSTKIQALPKRSEDIPNVSK
jgi:hypothetical protein